MNDPTIIAHAYNGAEAKPIALHLTLRYAGLEQFRNILQRALNCAPPHEEQYKDWFALADLLEGKTEVKGASHV